MDTTIAFQQYLLWEGVVVPKDQCNAVMLLLFMFHCISLSALQPLTLILTWLPHLHAQVVHLLTPLPNVSIKGDMSTQPGVHSC